MDTILAAYLMGWGDRARDSRAMWVGSFRSDYSRDNGHLIGEGQRTPDFDRVQGGLKWVAGRNNAISTKVERRRERMVLTLKW